DLLRIELGEKGRRFLRNGTAQSAASFAGDLVVVALAPEHLAILSEGPEERRQFLDRALFALEVEYLETLRRFQRALRHKQALLRSELPLSVYCDQATPWNEELAIYGQKVRESRIRMVKQLKERMGGSFAGVDLLYEVTDEGKDRDRTEHSAQRVLWGPHRD